MPMYTWRDKKSEYQLDVIRPYHEYREPPREDELPEEERGKEREWQRIIDGVPTVTKSFGFGSKGNW